MSDASVLADVETRTVLFTDLARSTSFHSRYGPRLTEALRTRIDYLTRLAIRHWRPQYIKSTGDGIMAVFSTASGAVAASAAIQHAIDRLRLRTDLPPAHLRIGLSSGDVQLQDDGDCKGQAVDEAKRLESRAPEDGILAADVVKMLDRNWSGARYGEPIRVDLDNWPEPVVAHVVDWQTLDLKMAPAVSLPPDFEDALRSPFPLAEREALLSKAREDVLALDGHGLRLVLLTGPSGIGKTRFLAELADNLRLTGEIVLVGRCLERPDSPLQCFRDVVDGFCATAAADRTLAAAFVNAGQSIAKVSDRVPSLLAGFGLALSDGLVQESQTELLAIYDSLVRWLANLGKRQHVILLLEDLHYATPEVEGFLRHVLSLGQPSELVVVGAVNPDLSHRGLRDFLPPAVDIPRVTTYELMPLSLFGIQQLLGALPQRRLGIAHMDVALTKDGERLAAALLELSGGLPSLVNLLVRETYDRGIAAMSEERGEWSITGDLGELGGLDSFHQLIQSRLARYDDATNEAVQELAVIGGTIEFDLFSRVTRLDRDVAAGAVVHLVEARVLSRDGSTGRFETRAIERAIYNAIGPAQCAAIHERVAQALLERAMTEKYRVPHGRIAGHLAEALKLAGRGAARAIAFYFGEGTQALKEGHATDAYAAYDTALVLLDTHDLEDQAEFRSRLLVARARALTDAQAASASRARDGAREVAEGLGRPELMDASAAELDAFFERWRGVVAA
jgi:class 3 adenylate cyclase